MLNLKSKELKLFKSLIGQSVSHLSSEDISDYSTELCFLSLSIKIHFNNGIINNLLITCDINKKHEGVKDFFEIQNGGIAYYNYKLIKNDHSSNYDEMSYELNYSPIKKIEIYGRMIPETDAKELMAYDKKLFKNAKTTDDVFLFYCENGEKFIIAFGDFSYGIYLFKGKNITINTFFQMKDETSVYKLNHVIL